MKRLVFVAITITQIAISCKKDSQDDCKSRYYYYSSDKISLTDVPGTGTISFYDTISAGDINQILNQHQDLQLLSVHENTHRIIISINSTSCLESDIIISSVKKDPRISNCNMFLTGKDGSIIGIYDVFVCKLKSDSNLSQLNDLLSRTRTTIIRAGLSTRHYLIRADKNSSGDALDMANEFFESGYFEYAEPDFINAFHTFN
jgi:hypothetical protein